LQEKTIKEYLDWVKSLYELSINLNKLKRNKNLNIALLIIKGMIAWN